MDIAAVLGHLLALARRVLDPPEGIRPGIEEAEGLAEHFERLDLWMLQGGFSPWPEVPGATGPHSPIGPTLAGLRQLSADVLAVHVRINSGVEAAEQLASDIVALDALMARNGGTVWA